jgi:hypothetical protein
MAKVVVYRFVVFYGELGRYVEAKQLATAERIKLDLNHVVRGSGISVDESEIDSEGLTSQIHRTPNARPSNRDRSRKLSSAKHLKL